MGGPGSGNHYHFHRGRKKTAVENCLRIDANRWAREGILKDQKHQSGSWKWTYQDGRSFNVNYQVNTLDPANRWVQLRYSWTWTATKQAESVDYRVPLATTKPRFGGFRWWFRCPLLVNGWPCRRRVAKLYLPGLGRYFGCRQCHDLTYTSCQESHKNEGLLRHLAAEMEADLKTVRDALKDLAKRNQSDH